MVQDLVKPGIKVAAQNCSATGAGAFTGEVNAAQVADAGLEWVLLGHSERRKLYGETEEMLGTKLSKAMEAGLKVIYCIGEQLEDREAGKTNDVIAQHMATVYACPNVDYEKIVIAYEPVWAIGTGKVATPVQAEDADKVSKDVADGLRIQYGGSVSAANCVELMSCPNIDGFLVGGASLKPEFTTIIKAAADSA